MSPNELWTLGALDSTKLSIALAQALDLRPDEIALHRAYGGHSEQKAVFTSQTKIGGCPLNQIIGTPQFPTEK